MRELTYKYILSSKESTDFIPFGPPHNSGDIGFVLVDIFGFAVLRISLGCLPVSRAVQRFVSASERKEQMLWDI